MRQRSLDEMITYFNQEIDKMDIDRRYKIALLGMVTAIGCTAKQTIEERKKGEWRTTLYHISDDGNELYEHYCSECKKTVMISNLKKGRFKYCPNCGADMRGGDDEES